MVKALESQGVTLSVSSGSPTTFSAIANISKIHGPGDNAAVIDASNLDSIAREKMMGVPDEGQVTLDIFYDPDAATHVLLRAAMHSRTRMEFKITLTDADGTTLSFFGYVVAVMLNTALSDAIRGAVTIAVDGETTDGDSIILVLGSFAKIADTLANAGTIPMNILSYNNLLWIIGEVNSTGGGITGKVNHSVDGINWIQDTTAPAWMQGSLYKRRTSSCVFNNKMWIMGGYDGLLHGSYNSVYSSTDGITWTQETAAAAWSVRYKANLLVHDNKMWIIGGTTFGGPLLNDVWYSSDGITWTQATAAAAFFARKDHAAFTLAGKMWIAGGYDGVSAINNELWSSVDGITWTNEGNAAWPAKWRMGYAVLSGKAYVAAGNESAGIQQCTDDLWVSSDGITWTLEQADMGLQGVSGEALQCNDSYAGSLLVNHQTSLVVLGMMNNGTNFNTQAWQASLS